MGDSQSTGRLRPAPENFLSEDQLKAVAPAGAIFCARACSLPVLPGADGGPGR
jgi:hypothetical protein